MYQKKKKKEMKPLSVTGVLWQQSDMSYIQYPVGALEWG